MKSRPRFFAAPALGLAFILIIGTLLLGTGSACAVSQGERADTAPVPTTAPSEEPINRLLAGLSDEQARQMLLEELRKTSRAEQPPAPQRMKGPGAFLSALLGSLSSEHDANEEQFRHLFAHVPQIFPDLYAVFTRLCPLNTSRGAVINVLWVCLFIGIGLLVEFLFGKFFLRKYFAITAETNLPQMTAMEKFMAGLTRVIPEVLGLIFFFGTAYFAFLLFIWTDSPHVQLFFLATLVTITAVRLIAILSEIVFSPSVRSFRVLPLACGEATTSHRLMVSTTGYILVVLMFAVIARKLGAAQETVLLLQLFFATLLLAATAGAVVVFRRRIQEQIIAAADDEHQSLTWGRKQFAAVWHIVALTYLFILWFLLLNDLADPQTRNSGAFILSFFVVPIWMVADRLIQWVVKYAMDTLKIHRDHYPDQAEPDEEVREQRRKGKEMYVKVNGLARIGVVGALLVWVASLWSIRIPFFSNLASVLLDALVILTVALFFWQFISSWIERKIQESVPEAEDTKEDDEWGGAASRGRSYTLLPMIRKFIGTTLVVMVTMTILSSMGVDIGPLLAGAGVVGLAIGFGAQKLVADMFSGFFYLLDDAFRVGEYMTAGSVSGTVESITLRNVMLRHHRGMLQIVPHSDLGAITNYMRGGIIVKFNLDFPYDSDIDLIRRIIKKVGQAMLENEEYGKDFINPVKSQGVREITNSVMTIRVKFTAKPGTHFIIRREAYRLITEALNAKGIYYAHRKVIVDLPETVAAGQLTPEVRKQLTEAAGAAAIRVIEEEEKAARDAAQAGGGSAN